VIVAQEITLAVNERNRDVTPTILLNLRQPAGFIDISFYRDRVALSHDS